MGIFDKIKGMVGSEDLDYNEYDGDLFGDDMPGADPMADAMGAQPGYEPNYNTYEAPQPQPQPQPRQQSPLGGTNLELKVVKPDRYENVNQIADHLLNRRTVVLNLEGTNKETARRLIDFLSGVAYSIDGQLKRVANNTFVITPHNVDVSGDQLRGPEPKPEPKSPIDEDDIYSSEL
ncbi:MAG: cell division protein SepF [Ruminococcaceae bacterium]|nr:cell division protein SepF [Oscillospiraceae bacterium]